MNNSERQGVAGAAIGAQVPDANIPKSLGQYISPTREEPKTGAPTYIQIHEALLSLEEKIESIDFYISNLSGTDSCPPEDNTLKHTPSFHSVYTTTAGRIETCGHEIDSKIARIKEILS